MRIAYVNYGNQSGVTPNVIRGLQDLGHRVVSVDPTGVLALRDRRTRLPRPTPQVLMSLAVSAIRHGPQLMHHRWNTVYAFDQHSKQAGEMLDALPEAPYVVLQNVVGVLSAKLLDLHPIFGLVGGSITLVGGHGTGAAYAERFAEVNNLQSVMELSMTVATIGLILGGIVAGPVAQYVIGRHQLRSKARMRISRSDSAAIRPPRAFVCTPS